jgi:hypothetical protein
MKKHVVYKFGAVFIVAFFWIVGSVHEARGADLARSDRQILRDWARERDVAVDRYMALWFRGAPPQKRAAVAASILASEAHIVTFCLGNTEALRRYSLLWERSVTEQTLPGVLMEERYRVDLGVSHLFARERE